MNYYELLEISSSASVEVIRNAYKTLAKKYHPDTYKGDTAFAEEKMKLLNEAVSVLENEDKRKEYNKINGINPLSKSGYSDYGRNNMLNVDENGEPIFFSYDLDDNMDAPDVSEEPEKSYMDIIDDFLKSSHSYQPAKKPKKKPVKNKNAVMDIDDISEIIINDGQSSSDLDFGYGENMPADISDSSFGAGTDFVDEAESEAESDFRTFEYSGRTKNMSNKLKAYYIIVASIVTAIIVLIILIMGKLDLKNIKALMSGLSGSGKNPDDAYVFDESATTAEKAYDFITESEEILTDDPGESEEITIEDSEPSSAEETANDIPPPLNQNPIVVPPVQVQTDPPKAEKPAETKPPAPPAETTEKIIITEPVTEPPTEAPTTTEATTEAPVTEPETEPVTEPETEEETTTEEVTTEESVENTDEPDITEEISEPDDAYAYDDMPGGE